jgi:hypothetical protein
MVGKAARMVWKHTGLADRTGAAGNVDENVDATAKCVLGGPDRGLALPGVGQIAGDHDRLAALGFDFVGYRRDGCGIASHQRQFAAFGGKRVGDRSAHSLCGARDQDDAILK